ncbi:DUF7537 family lipoprotein [Halovenus halobia]|uniref:DUF7537 family lipoprotein n=1 Tax=Halovenus halobia TaxID=3396622 RepID=UPI003F557658
MTERISARRRRILLVFAVAALVALAGCSGADSPSASNNGTEAAGGDEPGANDEMSTGADEEPTLDSVTANASEALAEIESFTLETTSRTSNATQSLTVNQTIRADIDAGAVYAVERSDLRGNTNGIVVTERYGSGETVFVRNSFPAQNFTFYERQRVTDAVEESVEDTESGSLADRYEFSHSRTADGDHRFTADSVEQFTGSVSGGTVESLSAEVIVDADTGLVTEVEIRLTATTEQGELTISEQRTLSELGTTTVTEPDWLDTARDETGQGS